MSHPIRLSDPNSRNLGRPYNTVAPSVTGNNRPTTKSGHSDEGVTTEEMCDCVWLRPEIEAEIKFAEWTTGEVLRHAEFVSLRLA